MYFFDSIISLIFELQINPKPMQQRILLTLITFLACFSIVSAEEFYFDDYEDTLYLDFIETLDENHLKVDFVVNSFQNISTMQFTIKYSEGITLDSIAFGDFPARYQNFNTNLGNLIPFSWNAEAPLLGFSLPDGSIIYSLHFTVEEANEANIEIVSNPTTIEITNWQEDLVVLVTDGSNILFSGNYVSGQLYGDFNNNCKYDEGDYDLSDWLLNIIGESGHNYAVTDRNGRFKRYLEPGSYTIYPEMKNNLWAPCVEAYDITIDENSGLTEIDFGLLPTKPCSAPRVSVETIFLRRCFDNTFYLDYCNDGTTIMEDAYVELDFDPRLILVSEDIPILESSEGYLKIAVGTLEIGECRNKRLVFHLDCETTDLGDTHCMEAVLGPVQDCSQAEGWSGASLIVTGDCDGNEVEFIIENVGDGPMAETRSFIVIEDDVMLPQYEDDYDLDPGDTIRRRFPANGSTYRLIADQELNHPFSTKITTAVEGCGTNIEGSYSKGFVTQFAAYDDEPFKDILCRENIGSYDPNDKKGFPKGYGETSFIYTDTDLDYLIRFQNTGTDTAFNIVIKDILAEEVDLSSIVVGPSSHHYTWKIENERTIVFTFDDILLPDSTTNNLESQGFIKYKIAQTSGNLEGTQINNEADIYFDFNEPIRTNLTKHTIGNNFVVSDLKGPDALPTQQLRIYPNPTNEGLWLENTFGSDEFNVKIRSSEGRLIYNTNFSDNINYLPKTALSPGINFLTISTSDGRFYSGKIVQIND